MSIDRHLQFTLSPHAQQAAHSCLSIVTRPTETIGQLVTHAQLSHTVHHCHDSGALFHIPIICLSLPATLRCPMDSASAPFLKQASTAGPFSTPNLGGCRVQHRHVVHGSSPVMHTRPLLAEHLQETQKHCTSMCCTVPRVPRSQAQHNKPPLIL
jgi:hypothetical protein